MKRMLLLAVLSASAILVFGEAVKFGPATPPDPEKERQRRLEKREAKLKKTGGRIVDMTAMKGTFRFINLQRRLPAEKLKEVSDRLGQYFMSDFALVEGKGSFSVEGAAGALPANGATAAVFLVESEGLPSVLVAPEAKWAAVNVSALAADGADETKLTRRTKREMLRAFASLAGGGGSMDPVCVSRTATSLAELDALRSNDLTYEPLLRAEIALQAMGITPYRRTTYLEACEEGWAPAPTNDIQKAIWDKVHSIPQNPMKIEFDPKKGR